MNTVTKREFVRRPSMVSHLKPGESIEIPDGKSSITVSRRKKNRLSYDEIESELRRLSEKAPAMDCQSVLNDLRR